MIAGPRLPAWLQTAWWFFGRFSFARGCSRRYGRCFRIRLLGFGEVVVVTDPVVIRRLLSDRNGALEGGRANAFGGLIRELAGEDTILLKDGLDHARLRAALEPALGSVARDVEENARGAARRSIARWPKARPFALMPYLERISFEVFAVKVLGVSGKGREHAVDVLEEWAAAWNDPQVVLPFLRARWGRSSRWRRFVAARDAVQRLIKTEIESDYKADARGSSVAEELKAAESLSDAEIQNQLLTLFISGHGPTVNGMAWALELLLRHPAVLERLRSDLAAGDEMYLDAVVSETLRMRPVGQWMARRVVQPVEIYDDHVDPGALLVPNAFLAHHDEALHPDAERYVPERFLSGDSAKQACLPFGHGARKCPGAGLAMAQIRGVLREVVASVDLGPGRTRPEQLVPDGVSLVPKHGVVAIALDRDQVTGESAIAG